MTPLHTDDFFLPGAGDTQPVPLDAHRLLAQLGRDVANRLTPAIDRVKTLSASGRIDRQSLRDLRHEIDQARRDGLLGLDLARMLQGVQLTPTPVDLRAVLRDTLQARAQDMDSRGIVLRPLLGAAQVVSDATLLPALLHAALDWSFEHAAGCIALQLQQPDAAASARLHSVFAYRVAAGDPGTSVPAAAAPGADTLASMSWRLLEQTAVNLGVRLRRRDAQGRTELTIDFPPPAAPTSVPQAVPAHQRAAPPATAASPATVDAAAARPHQPRRNAAAHRAAALPDWAAARGAAAPQPRPADQRSDSDSTRPLAGFHVLVLATRRDVRGEVRDALRGMDLLLDFVTSVDEARLFCADALPQALVYEAAQDNADFQRLRDALLRQRPLLGLISIAEQGKSFDVLDLGERGFASIGRDGLHESLPAALMFELFRRS